MSIDSFKEVAETGVRPFSDCRLGRMTEGKAFEKPMGEYDKPLGVVDDTGKVYMEEVKLLPQMTYVLNGNIYKTDEKGRIISCDFVPKHTPENTRDNDAQGSAGGIDRKSGDQGGHIVGRDLGGDGGLGNLVSMDSRINQSDYKKMENDIKNRCDSGENVAVNVKLEYSAASERPDKIIATVTSDTKNIVYTFDNNLDGSLIEKLKKTCEKSDIETVKSVLNDTNGQISSIKEEYNLEGTLEKTSISITYIGEDGKNYRRPVVINNGGGSQ